VTPRTSPLDAAHRALGAKLVPFGGWDMPLSYSEGTLAEHRACRTGAVVFDVSHLGTVRVEGPDALERLQRALTNDLLRIGVGRAARNVDGQVIMYADKVTDSMQRAISETHRRRGVQLAYNAEHGINPVTIRKAVTDILAHLRPAEDRAPVAFADSRNRKRDKPRSDLHDLPAVELERLIRTLEEEMRDASADLRFEYAARLRDEIKDLKRELREAVG